MEVLGGGGRPRDGAVLPSLDAVAAILVQFGIDGSLMGTTYRRAGHDAPRTRVMVRSRRDVSVHHALASSLPPWERDHRKRGGGGGSPSSAVRRLGHQFVRLG